MKEKRAISLLSTFSKKEWSGCERYIKQRYSTDGDIYALWAYFKKNKTTIKDLKFDEKVIATKLGIKASNKKIQNLLSDLSTTIDQYAVSHYLDEQKSEYERLRIKVYQKRGLHQFSDKKILDTIKEANESKDLSLFHHRNIHSLYHTLYFSHSKYKLTNGPETLKKCINTFLIFINDLLTFYKLEAVNRHLIFNENYEEELKLINQGIQETIRTPISTHFQSLTKLLEGGDKSHYKYLEDKLRNDELDLSIELKSVIFIYLHKYLNDQIRLTNKAYLADEIFELHKIADEQNLLIMHNTISKARFVSIANAAALKKEFEWLDKFIEKYSPFLEKSEKEETIEFVKAEILFRKGQLKEAIFHFSQISFKNPNYVNSLKNMLLMCYYEMYKTNPEKITEYTNSFKNWLRYNEANLGRQKIVGSKNLIKIVTLLINNEAPDLLLATYQKMEYIQRRIWVIKELEKRGCFDQ